ncbi:hypothetical protein [Xiamenia xianingshaonis]|uniref:ABC-2 type transport system permease protein n=1 Tax=Xiamenia xianingshaonis TaxID=2682776 RepID=A0A9E6STV2_9ACTN|nr:hypothetical protein [Xiamenia xianingshaonis]NHM14931.1 hypothetical protein [Xiamenia xianingshaonis]QTU83739.1 hypothetical protein J7S26_04910 [Xiamenia xianingshaonis]
MSLKLFTRQLHANLAAACIVGAVIALYAVCVTMMYDPALGESLDAMKDAMPELFAAFGMAGSSTTLADFMINYLQQFLLVCLPLVLVALATRRMLAQPLETGSLSCVISLPLGRHRIIATYLCALFALLAGLLIVTTAIEVGCAEALFPGELDTAALLRANAGLLPLWSFLGAVCFLAVIASRRADRGFATGLGICLASYLATMLADMAEGWEFLDAINPLAFYDAYGLAAGEPSAAAGCVALAAAALALAAVAALVFGRRDFSI